MTETYNFTNGSITGQPKPVATLPNTTGLFTRSNIVDFANQNLDAGNGDIAQIINIPADTWVLSVSLRIITAGQTNETFDIGSGLDVDQWGDGITTTTGNKVMTWAPEYFASADTIDIKATTDTADVNITTTKVEVVALMCPGAKSDGAGTQVST